MSKFEIKAKDLKAIVDLALRKYQDFSIMPDNSKELQAYLFLHSLQDYLIIKGVEPSFEIKSLDDDRKGDKGSLDEIL